MDSDDDILETHFDDDVLKLTQDRYQNQLYPRMRFQSESMQNLSGKKMDDDKSSGNDGDVLFVTEDRKTTGMSAREFLGKVTKGVAKGLDLLHLKRFDQERELIDHDACVKRIEREEQQIRDEVERYLELANMEKREQLADGALTRVFGEPTCKLLHRDKRLLEFENGDILIATLCARAVCVASVLDTSVSVEKQRMNRQNMLKVLGIALNQQMVTDEFEKSFEDEALLEDTAKKCILDRIRELKEGTYLASGCFQSVGEYEEHIRSELHTLKDKYLEIVHHRIRLNIAEEEELARRERKKAKRASVFSRLFGCCSSSPAVDVVFDREQDLVDKAKRRLDDEIGNMKPTQGRCEATPDHLLCYRIALWRLTESERSEGTIYTSVHADSSQRYLQFEDVAGDLSTIAQQTLKAIDSVYRVGISGSVSYMELLVWNLSSSVEYFNNITCAVDDLEELWEDRIGSNSPQWTVDDTTRYKNALRRAFIWGCFCMSRYQDVFFENTDALKACLEMMQVVWASVVSQQITVPVLERAEHFVHIDLDLEIVANRTLEHTVTVLVRQAVSVAYANIKARSVEVVKAAETNLEVLGDIQDPQQLMVLFSDVREEVGEDMKLDEVFQRLVSVKLSSVAGETYTSLLFSECNVYLRQLWESYSETLSAVRIQRAWRLSRSKKGGGRKSSQSIRDDENEKQKMKFPDKVFALYHTMQEYFEWVKRDIVDFSDDEANEREYAANEWFKPFVKRWLQLRGERFTESYLQTIIASDKWEPLTSKTSYSSSVVDVFKLLTPVCAMFKRMPYTQEHVFQFATFVSDVIRMYVDMVATSVHHDIKNRYGVRPTVWGFDIDEGTGKAVMIVDSGLTVRLNNLAMCKQKLVELLNDLDLPDVYQNEPKFFGIKEDEDTNVDEEEVREQLEVELDCYAGLRAVNAQLESLGVALAEGMSGYVRQFIQTVLWARVDRSSENNADVKLNVCGKPAKVSKNRDTLRKAFDYPLSKDVISHAVMPMLNYIADHLDHLGGYADGQLVKPQLYEHYFDQIAGRIYVEMLKVYDEKLVAALRRGYGLFKNQVKRLKLAVERTQEFFRDEYALPAYFFKEGNHEELDKLMYHIDLMGGDDSTSLLVTNWKIATTLLGESPKGKHYRQKVPDTPPYLSIDQLEHMLIFRGESEEDHTAKAFCAANKISNKGFFKRWFS